MRRPVLRTAPARVTAAVAAGAATCAVLASGTAGGAIGALVDATRSLTRLPAAAATDGLSGFDSCEQLRRWHVRTALPDVGPWGLSGPRAFLAQRSATDVAAPRAGGAPETAVGASVTGTNVQEAGVDEPDVAKTDGRLLVRISGRSLVVTDVRGDRPRELSRAILPGGGSSGAELLLSGDRVLVVSSEDSWANGPTAVPDGVRRAWPADGPRSGRTRLLSYDLADPSAPRLVDDRSMGGSAVSTRLYPGDTVRVVLRTPGPELPFVQPGPHRSPAEAARTNRRLVRTAPVAAWLPTVRSAAGERPLVGCDDVRRPRRPAGAGTLSVVGFALAAPERDSVTAITTAGELVYSSAVRLYVAMSDGRATSVHAFALHGGRTSYVASGTVPGSVKDRWSLSEHDGHLRVATTSTPTSSLRSSSAVRVLAERDDRLLEIAHVGGLGVDEILMSVRWFGDLAVLVTFRRVDPLFTVDLADPARPRLLGELKVPGFSSYLHPVGGDLLVGLGRDATLRGRDRGAQAATFDLRDLADVRRADTLDLGRDTWLVADQDPRTVSYLPAQRLLVTVESSWRSGRSRFVALHISPSGHLTRSRSWATRPGFGTATRALPLGRGRVALVDGSVRLVRLEHTG